MTTTEEKLDFCLAVRWHFLFKPQRRRPATARWVRVWEELRWADGFLTWQWQGNPKETRGLSSCTRQGLRFEPRRGFKRKKNKELQLALFLMNFRYEGMGQNYFICSLNHICMRIESKKGEPDRERERPTRWIVLTKHVYRPEWFE